MNNPIGPYRTLDLSPGRRIWVNTLELSWPAHSIYGLLEVDVTVARQRLNELEAQTGEDLSFTAFVAVCVARAVAEHKEVQAYLQGRGRLILRSEPRDRTN